MEAIQESQYRHPYHHFVSFDRPSLSKELPWGVDYYSYISRVIREFSLVEAQTVADVGCGDGKLIYELAQKYPRVSFTGYDLSEKAISFAKAYAHGLKNAIFFAEDFKYNYQTYDVIFCIETLEHISDEDTKDFINLLISHLNPGGTLIVTVPSTYTPVHEKHYRHYSRHSLSLAIPLSPVKLEYIGSKTPRWFNNKFFSINSPRLFRTLATKNKHTHVLGVFKK